MDSITLFKYLAVFGVGFFLGRITMALQAAFMKKKGLNKNND